MTRRLNVAVRTLLELIPVAVAYAVAGKLALLLALPPGYATAVWPPAGIGLACVLLMGRHAAIGVWLGSFALNCYVTVEQGTPVNLASTLSVASTIGIGAALQALVAAMLIRRTMPQPITLTRDLDVAWFCTLAGPVACIIAATIGVGTLHLHGQIPSAAVPFSWFTWWIGDAIGVLIFTPLVLILVAKPNTIWHTRRWNVGLPLCVTFAAAVVIFVISSKWERLNDRSAHDRRAAAVSAAIESRFERSADVLRCFAGLFDSSDHVDRREFDTFARQILRPDDGIQAVSWIPRVAGAARSAHEAYARQEGLSRFQITAFSAPGGFAPAPERAEYFPVTYIAPLTGNQEAVGLDVAFGQTRCAALDAARDTGRASLTGRIHLVQEHGGQFGAVMFVPLYRRDASTDSIEQRRAALLGYNSAVFRLRDLIEAATRGMDREGLLVRLIDESADADDRILFSEPGWNKVARDDESFLSSRTFEAGGRRWTIESCRSATHLAANRSLQSWAVLAGGLVLTSLLGSFLLALTGRTFMTESLVVARTRELSTTNQQLSDEKRATHKLLRQVEAARDAAQQATRAKTEFLANMSHEVRTPMTAILGFTDRIARPDLPQDKRVEYATIVRRNGDHLLNVINDILDLSRIEAGELAVEDILFSLDEVIGDVDRLLRPSATAKSIALVIERRGLRDVLLRSDPTRLRQILLNVVTNAIKFTNRGEVRLTCDLSPAPAADGSSRVESVLAVSDTGVGMTEKQLSRVFQPFAQGDSSTTRRFGGSGLGLAISKRLIEMLGGSIVVASAPGIGSKFTITMVTESAEGMPLHSSDKATCPDAIAASRKRPRLDGRILIAEDGRDNRDLVGAYLRDVGLTVEEATNGWIAIQKVVDAANCGQPYDVVLMDMQMPELDGYAATERLRQSGHDLPIIALTAHTMPGDREKCLAAGCDDYTTKPLNVAELIATIEAHLPANRARGTSSAAANRPPKMHAGAGRLVSTQAGNPIVAKLLPQYLKDLEDQVAALRAAVAAEEGKSVRRIIHSLKGTGGSYGFPDISTAAARLLERIGPDGSEMLAARTTIEQLIDLIARIDRQGRQYAVDRIDNFKPLSTNEFQK